MNANTTKTIIGTLLPFASNPVVLTIIGVGAAAWAIASIFDNDNEDECNSSNAAEDRSEPSKQPLNRNRSTVQSTVHEPFKSAERPIAVEDNAMLATALSINETDNSADYVEESPVILNNDHTTNIKATLIDDEAAQKEMIRKTMSELGKRSGAARRKAMIARNSVPE